MFLNKKRTIIILSVAAALLVVTGFMVFSLYVKNTDQIPNLNNGLTNGSSSQINQNVLRFEKANEIASQIISGRGDANGCQNLTTSDEKDQCYLIVSLSSQDEGGCNQIINEARKNECLGEIIANQAETNSNPDLCFTINDSWFRLNCLFRVRSQVENPTELCNRLTNNDEKNECLSVMKIDEGGTVYVDTDNDGLYDVDEDRLGTNKNSRDTDSDGIIDGDEVYLYHTDPLKADTDGDGLNDKSEIDQGLNPTSSDTDGDGISDSEEIQLGLDPKKSDTDGDGLSDGREKELGTNPKLADTDGDGLSDYEEINQYGTDPKNPDTDGDGYSDGVEVRGGYNPRGPGRIE